MNVCIYTYMYLSNTACVSRSMQGRNTANHQMVCISVYIYVCMCIYIHIYIYI